MGWDAYATKDGAEVFEAGFVDGRYQVWIPDPEIAEAFKKASERPGAADGFIPWGGLDVSSAGKALEKATGMNAWGEALTPEEVQEYAAKADWSWAEDFGYEELKGSWESARAFLEACAELRLGITFSW